MKLFAAVPSPYVRKVKALCIEAGLAGQVDDVATPTTPVATNAALADANPLGKIPALLLDDGRVLYDSRVICDYLDGLAATSLIGGGDARIDVLTRQALADGLLDAAVLTRYETFLRPEDKRWPEWIDAQMAKIRRALDAMDSAIASAPSDRFDLGDIAFACACGYMDFRYSEEGWRTGRDALADWYEKASARESIATTKPE